MVRPGRGISLQGDALTDAGRVRENNEDNVYLWRSENFLLAVVADGMGGAAAGEEASRIAVQTIEDGLFEASLDADRRRAYRDVSAEYLSDKLREVIREANANIVQHTYHSPHLKGMGTTITMAFVRDAYAVIGHVGDSRAYLVDGTDGDISQITSDHSFVEAMVAAGHISREEAEDHPMRNVLYRALGQADDIDVDVYHSYLRANDRLILCSDGLTLHVAPEEIASVALEDNNPEVISRRLVNLANNRGGRDNISVVVIIVDEQGAPEDHENHASAGDDETLVLRDRDSRPFVSSESSEPPRSEPRDNHTPNLRLSGNPVGLRLLRRHAGSSDPQAGPLLDEDEFGEGQDPIKPDL